MKILFYALTFVAIVAAAYFSNVGKAKIEKQLDYREKIIGQNRLVTSRADDTAVELKDEENLLEKAKDRLADTNADIGVLESDVTKLERDLAQTERTKGTRLARIEEIEASLEAVKALVADLGFVGKVDGKDLADAQETFEKRRDALTAQIAEVETNIDGAEKAIASNRDEISKLSQRKAERDSRVISNAREAQVTAVDTGWGFVVIGAGRSSGFEPQGRLIIKRNGKVVGEVVPSSIEATQTIAEIDFKTLAPGALIQPGDQVMPLKPFTK